MRGSRTGGANATGGRGVTSSAAIPGATSSRSRTSCSPSSAPYSDLVRWMVDGMNVIGSRPDGWWRDRDGAMARLVDLLERFASRTGDDVTVVFERKPRPSLKSTVIEIA